MTALTVNELVDLLAKEIAAGNGNHEVLVVLNASDVRGEPLDDLIGRHNWQIRTLGVPDHPADRFVTLDAHPEVTS